MVGLFGVVTSEPDLVAHMVSVIPQDIVDLTQGPTLKLVPTNSVLGRGQSNEGGVSCQHMCTGVDLQYTL